MDELFDIILNQIAFYELASDEELDPDTSVDQMERIMYDINDLNDELLDSFKSFVEAKIKDEENDDLIEVYKNTLESLEQV